jgi:hypothetical protein
VNSSELHCPQVSIVHAKQVFVDFSFQRFKRKKHVDPMHSKVSFVITKRLRTAFLIKRSRNRVDKRPHFI